tara:strand:+ start:14766 stop:15725 length:960 start_codon:yes stop_codon:yes gene_type:complete
MNMHNNESRGRGLNVYAAGPRSLMRQLVTRFEADTGIHVNLVQAPTGRILARLEAEADSPRADVFVSASWDLAEALERRGWLLPHESPNATTVPDAFRTPTYVAQAMSALAIVWNTASGTPEPTDWADLAAPVWENRLTMPDPALSGTSVDLLSGLVEALPGEAWALFAQLRRNGMVVAGSNDQALAPVLRGDRAAVFGSVDYVAWGSLAQGANIKVIFPRSGTVMVPRPMMILKSTRQPDHARAFIDHLLSDAGQRAAADAWLIPARQELPSRRPPVSAIKLLRHDATPTHSRDQILARFGEIFSAPAIEGSAWGGHV